METKRVKVVAKTADVSGYANVFFGRVSTYYYLTFEFEDKDRYFFKVSSEIFALTAEGDYGELTYKIKNTYSGEELVFESFERLI